MMKKVGVHDPILNVVSSAAQVCANCSSPIVADVVGGGRDTDNEKNMHPKHLKKKMMYEITVKVDVEDGKTRKSSIKVKSALASLYNLQYLNDLPTTIFCSDDDDEEEEEGVNENVKKYKNKNGVKFGDSDEGVVGLCSKCSHVLENLLKYYNEFEQLRKVDSYVERRIRKWNKILQQLLITLTEMMTTTSTEEEFKNSDEEKVKNSAEENTEKILEANVNDKQFMDKSDNNSSCDTLPCPPVQNNNDDVDMVDCENNAEHHQQQQQQQTENAQQSSLSTLADNDSGHNITTMNKDDVVAAERILSHNGSCGKANNGTKKRKKLKKSSAAAPSSSSSLNPFVKLFRLTANEIKTACNRGGGSEHNKCVNVKNNTKQVMIHMEDPVSHLSASNNNVKKKAAHKKGNLCDTLQNNCRTFNTTATTTNCNTPATTNCDSASTITNPSAIICSPAAATAAVVVVDGPRDKLLCDNPNARRVSCDANLNPVIMSSYVVDDNYFMDEGSDDLADPSPLLDSSNEEEEVEDDNEFEWKIVTDDDVDNHKNASKNTTASSKSKVTSKSSSPKSPKKAKSRSSGGGGTKKRKSSQSCSNNLNKKRRRPTVLTSSNNNNEAKPFVNSKHNNSSSSSSLMYVCSLCPCEDKQSFLVQTDLCQHFLSAHVDYNSFKSCPFSTCSRHHTESFTDLFQLTTHLATVHVSVVPKVNNVNNYSNSNKKLPVHRRGGRK